MTTPRLRLGQLLVDARLIAQADLEAVLALQKTDGRRIGTLLVERGLVNETQLTQILSHQLSVPWVSLLHIEFSRQLLNLVPHDVAERYCLVPIYVRHVRNQGETLYVAMEDPSNEEGLRACGEHSGLPVRAMIAPPTDIRSAIRVYYQTGSMRPVTTQSEPPAGDDLDSDTYASEPSMEAAPSEPQYEEPAPPPHVLPAEPEIPPPPFSEEPEPPVVVHEEAPPLAEPAVAAESADDAPVIEAVEVELPRKSAPSSSPPSADIPRPRGKAPRMVALTLLDGTTITLPARRSRKAQATPPPPPSEKPPSGDSIPPGELGLTARDLVSALRAVSHGADASEVLGNNPRWEAMFSALLSLLLKKHLIADWEFVEELKKI